jgi:hypothetical protein
LKSGIVPGVSSLPCMKGTLVNTPIPNLTVQIIDFFQVMLDHNSCCKATE